MWLQCNGGLEDHQVPNKVKQLSKLQLINLQGKIKERIREKRRRRRRIHLLPLCPFPLLAIDPLCPYHLPMMRGMTLHQSHTKGGKREEAMWL